MKKAAIIITICILNLLNFNSLYAQDKTWAPSLEPVAQCIYVVTPDSSWFVKWGGSDSILVESDGCIWTATSNETWISIISGATGSDTGMVHYSVDINPDSARTGILMVAGWIVTVSQDAGIIQPICLITVDSTFTKNIIVWEKPITTEIDSFRIYRDIIGTYKLIGSQPYSALSEFIDNTNGVNPNITSYRYKISAIDTNGNENVLSAHHETIHLTVNTNFPTNVNLAWDAYEGFSYTYYRILRDDNNTDNWQAIDSVSSANTTYTDLNPPTDSSRYIVEVVSPVVCVSSKNFVSSKSNSPSANPVSIGETSSKINTLMVYPNPNSGEFTIEIQVNQVQDIELKIVNLLGQVVFEDVLKQLTGAYSKVIDLTGFAKGVYELQIQTKTGIVNKSIILE